MCYNLLMKKRKTITAAELSASADLDQGQRDRITATSERAEQSAHFGLLTPAMHIDVRSQVDLPSGERWMQLSEAAELLNLEPRSLRRRCQKLGIPKNIGKDGVSWIWVKVTSGDNLARRA